jgi:hypothetical protein
MRIACAAVSIATNPGLIRLDWGGRDLDVSLWLRMAGRFWEAAMGLVQGPHAGPEVSRRSDRARNESGSSEYLRTGV